METEETISLRDLIYTICEVHDIQQESELKKLTDEFEIIRQELLKLNDEERMNEHNLYIAVRTANTIDKINLLIDKVKSKQITMNEFAKEVISEFKILIKGYENSNKGKK